tara:strand:+ start:471 stop:1673 length:1203 start_codon:yes stop_codon:yes gene_type:complete
MPGYGGGTGGADADYGKGMGTKGAAAADHSIGMGAGAGAASSDTSIEAFREAIARAMVGYVDQDVRDTAKAEQDAIDAAVAARDRALKEAEAQQERQAMMDQIDAMQKETTFATPATQAVPTEFDPQNPYDIEDPDVIDNKGWTLDESQFNDETNTDPVSPDSNPVGPTRSFQDQAMDDAVAIGAQRNISRSAQDQAMDDAVAIGAQRMSPAQQRSASLGTRARGARNPGKVAQHNLADYQSKQAFLQEVQDKETRVKELEAIENRTRKEQNELNNLKSLINQVKQTGRYSKAYATVHGVSPFGKAFLAMASLGLGWWGPKLGQAAIDRGFIDDRDWGDIANEIETSVNRPEPMPSHLKQLLNEAEPWTVGLSNRQIKYYLDRPSELEWVRNLWNQMNPS